MLTRRDGRRAILGYRSLGDQRGRITFDAVE